VQGGSHLRTRKEKDTPLPKATKLGTYDIVLNGPNSRRQKKKKRGEEGEKSLILNSQKRTGRGNPMVRLKRLWGKGVKKRHLGRGPGLVTKSSTTKNCGGGASKKKEQ